MADDLHCETMDPYLGSLFIGTFFFTFWVPIGSLFIVQGPYFQCFGNNTREECPNRLHVYCKTTAIRKLVGISITNIRE